MRLVTRDDALTDSVMRDPTTAPLDARARAFIAYAVKLTRAPSAVTLEDIDALRAAGLGDRGIHDLACVVAYFNFVNRTAEGLGVELEG